MKPFVTHVASSRHLAARTAVLYGPTSMHCLIYRRVLLDMPDNVARDDQAWGGIGQLSVQDEHAYELEKIGMARIKFAPRAGGMMLQNGSNQIGDTDTYSASIELYDDSAPKVEWPKQQFDWKIEDGDVIMVVPTWLPRPFYYEVAAIMATSVVPDFGQKYLLNARETLGYEGVPV